MQERLNFFSMGTALADGARVYKWYKSKKGIYGTALCKYWKLRHLILSIVTASDIDPDAMIGERLRLPHPNGVVIHGRAVIGDDCMIMQQVTVGQLADGYAPRIGSHVYIGAGAKVLGNVVIGDGARIGANAVVLRDVPANWTAVGIPARLISPETPRSSVRTDPSVVGCGI